MNLINKKIFLSIFILFSMVLFVSCSNKTVQTNNVVETTNTTEEATVVETTSQKPKFKIGVLQFVQHEALDKSYNGFVDYLKQKNIECVFDYQNASGEQANCQTISDKFINEDLDLIYAIATPAAQSVLAVDENIPIVASAVTDPASSKLCDSNEHPGGILTAASDLTPVEAQFDLLTELVPDAKNVGIFYCSAESNSKIQADMAESAATKRGLTPSVYTITNSSDIQTVIESMAGKVDVMYMPTDNTIAAGIDTVVTLANELKIPTICGEEGMVQSGGYATYGIDYYELGKIAGSLAEEILVNGKSPADLPVRYLEANECKRVINKETANILGLKDE